MLKPVVLGVLLLSVAGGPGARLSREPDHEIVECYEISRRDTVIADAVVTLDDKRVFTIGDANLACWEASRAYVATFERGRYLCLRGHCYIINGEGRGK
jgi:hypothetical protein